MAQLRRPGRQRSADARLARDGRLRRRRYRTGCCKLSDKGGDAEFTDEDGLRIRELAELIGAALDALRLSHERAAA